MIGAGLDEEGVALAYRERAALDLECSAPFEHDVDLVVLVWLLRIRVGRDEHVDTELEPRRAMHDFVAAAAGGEALLNIADREGVGYASASVGKPASAHAFRPPSITLTFS